MPISPNHRALPSSRKTALRIRMPAAMRMTRSTFPTFAFMSWPSVGSEYNATESMLFTFSFAGFDLDQPAGSRDRGGKNSPGGGLFELFQEFTERPAGTPVLPGDARSRSRPIASALTGVNGPGRGLPYKGPWILNNHSHTLQT